MREKEEEDNTQKKVLIYMMFPTQMRTHNHGTHMCTHTDFSHATGPRTHTLPRPGVPEPSAVPAYKSSQALTGVPLGYGVPERGAIPADDPSNANTEIQQLNPNLPSVEGSQTLHCSRPFQKPKIAP